MKKLKIFILGVIIQFSIINVAPAPPIEIGNIGGDPNNSAPIYTVQEVDNKIKQLTNKINQVEELANTHNLQSVFKNIFPVGSIYITYANQNPPLHGEYGITWEVLPEGYAILTATSHNTGSISGNNRLDTGTTEGHILTIEQMPKHSHDYVQTWTFKGLNSNNGSNNDNGMGKTSETGGNQPHNHQLKISNQKLMFWKRVA